MADDLRELGDEVHGDLNARLDALDGSMLVKHVTIAEVITPDGRREVVATHSTDMMAWETIGLLEYAKTWDVAAVHRIADEADEQDGGL